MPETLDDMGPFPEKLSLIRYILPAAPAANPEMRTYRRPVVGRLGQRLNYPRLGVIFFLLRYQGFYHLPGHRVVQKDHEPVHFGYSFAPKRELLNLKLDLRSFGYLFHTFIHVLHLIRSALKWKRITAVLDQAHRFGISS